MVTSGGDDSAELVRDRFPQLTVIDVPGRVFPGGARNLGVAATSGAAVAFLAADCLAEPGWAIGRMRAHGRGHAAVASAITTAPPQRPAAWGLHFDMYCYRLVGRPAGPLAAHDPAAYGLSFDRALLTRIGPFDDTVGIQEDTDAATRVSRAGVDVWYEPSIVTAHCGPRRFADVMAEASRRSASRGGVAVAGRCSRPGNCPAFVRSDVVEGCAQTRRDCLALRKPSGATRACWSRSRG